MKLAAVGKFGSKEQLFPIGDFLKEFKVAASKVEILANYLANDAAKHPDFVSFGLKFHVGSVIVAAAQMHSSTSFKI